MSKRERFAGYVTVFLTLCLISVSWGAETATLRSEVPEEGSVTPLLATGVGKLQSAKFLSNSVVVSNNSVTAWVNAFNTSVTLTGTAQCVKLGFTGEVKIVSDAASDFLVAVRATIDGEVLNSDTFQTVDIADPGVFSLTGMNWWKCRLAPGTHNVKVQFGPFFSGDVASVRQRTLIIEYAQ